MKFQSFKVDFTCHPPIYNLDWLQIYEFIVKFRHLLLNCAYALCCHDFFITQIEVRGHPVLSKFANSVCCFMFVSLRIVVTCGKSYVFSDLLSIISAIVICAMICLCKRWNVTKKSLNTVGLHVTLATMIIKLGQLILYRSFLSIQGNLNPKVRKF